MLLRSSAGRLQVSTATYTHSIAQIGELTRIQFKALVNDLTQRVLLAEDFGALRTIGKVVEHKGYIGNKLNREQTKEVFEVVMSIILGENKLWSQEYIAKCFSFLVYNFVFTQRMGTVMLCSDVVDALIPSINNRKSFPQMLCALVQIQMSPSRPHDFPNVPELRSVLRSAGRDWNILSQTNRIGLLNFLMRVLEGRNPIKTSIILGYRTLTRKIVSILDCTPKDHNKNLHVSVFKFLGNVTLNNDNHVDLLFEMKVHEKLLSYYSKCTSSTLNRLIMWILSNLAAGPERHIQTLIKSEKFMECIFAACKDRTMNVKKEAHWVVLNGLAGSNISTRQHLLSLGVLSSFSDMLRLSGFEKRDSVICMLKELAMEPMHKPFLRVYNLDKIVEKETWNAGGMGMVHAAGFLSIMEYSQPSSCTISFD